MYKLVIVDDETIIRKGICEFINWKGMGFELVASFEDGKETIEYLEKNQVDVVLTDIKMAEISGLELSKYIYDNKLQTKVVIISGYKEFEYARQAVEYGVEHYMLKPVRLDEINIVFEKIRNNLDKHRQKEKEAQEEKNKLAELLPQLQEQFFASLIGGALRKEEDILKRIEMLGLKIDPYQPCALIDVKPGVVKGNADANWPLGKEKMSTLIFNIFREERDSIRFFPAHLSGDIIKVVVVSSGTDSVEVLNEKINRYLLELSQFISSTLELKLNIYIEKSFSNLIELSSFENSFQVRSSRSDEPQDFKLVPEDYERLMQKYKLLVSVINEGDFEEMEGLAENIFQEFKDFPVVQFQKIIIDLFSMLSSKFLKLGVDLWAHINEKVDYQKIMNINDINELKLLCRSSLGDIMVLLKSQKNITSKELVKQAVKYMKDNYSKDISMEELSDRLFLNPAYFSRLFKQSTGSTFTDYLINVRMEKAIELLKCGRYKVYEVSEKVGYKSEKYFFRIFRQYTGYSPAEYCRNILKGSDNN